MNILFTSILVSFQFLLGFQLIAQNASPATVESRKAYVLKLDEEIFESTLRKFDNAHEEALEQGSELFIIELNTPGGLLSIADSLSSRLSRDDMTSIAFINHNAASAGALISLSCDSIFMTSDARIGAATVVFQDGSKASEKMQSYMRAIMKSVAQVNGRDTTMAEAMVDESIYIPGVIDSGKLLTLTTNEALRHNFCEARLNSLDEVLDHLNVSDGYVHTYVPSTTDNMIEFLTRPLVTGFLLMVIFWGIYFEMHSPGIGFPLLASMTAAVLYFAPNYLEGLAANWEIILFAVGVLLIVVELFVIPGFGVAGIAGLICMTGGLVLSLVGNDMFDFSNARPGQLNMAFTIVSTSFIASLVLLYFFGKNLLNSSYMKKLVLEKEQLSSEGYTTGVEKSNELIGKQGVAATDLKISGKIDVGVDRLDAITQGDFITQGTEIEIIDYRGNYFVVRSTS